MTDKTFPLPARNDAVLDYLRTRRSNKAKAMNGPGPSETELDDILQIGTRVPDHRKLSPWRIVVYRNAARERMGQQIAKVYREDHPDHPADRQAFEAARFLRAPVVLMVVSSPVVCPRGTPQWEQEMSAGAVCTTLLMAAQASGFAAQWLSEWFSLDDRLRENFGLTSSERIAGFIYIGSTTEPSVSRPRPNLSEIVSYTE